jgi:hypothetical protein
MRSTQPASCSAITVPCVSSVPGIEHDGTNNLPFLKKTVCFGGLAQRKVHRNLGAKITAIA